MSKNSTVDGKETLKIDPSGSWETFIFRPSLLSHCTKALLLLSSCAVVMQKCWKKNPWLASRIVKKDTADGVVALTYPRGLDARSAIEPNISPCMNPVKQACHSACRMKKSWAVCYPCSVPRSKPATDKNEVLFKVAVVPIEAETGGNEQSMPLAANDLFARVCPGGFHEPYTG